PFSATCVTRRPPTRFQPRRSSAPATSSPTHARRTVPKRRTSSATRTARSMGLAHPTPTEPPLGVRMLLLTPTTSPSAFASGPPELTELIAAPVLLVPTYTPNCHSHGRRFP